MATSVGSISTRLRNLVQDSDKIRWTDAEMLDWVNDAQKEISKRVLTAYPKRVIKALVAGTRQSLEALGVSDGRAVIDVVCNVSATNVYGKSIRSITREELDSGNPTWASETEDEVSHWAKEPSMLREFYVHPALSTVGGKVELIYSAIPPLLSNVTESIHLDDSYSTAIGYYVAFRLYSKDIEVADNAAIAASYFKLFTDSLN